MLETIRRFAEEQLVASGAATEVRAAHARYFAGRETDILALWDSPRQREAYDWFTVELANLRTAFRWATDHGDLDAAATIATYVGLLGCSAENYEPIAWAEELIEPARAADHPRLAFLYVQASLCCVVGRFEEAVRYSDIGQTIITTGHYEVPFGLEGGLGSAYLYIGQPERYVEVVRAQVARGHDTNPVTRTFLVLGLVVAGSIDEAILATNGLIDAAEATRNPYVLAYALLACGFAFRDADPGRSLEVLRRGLVIAQDSGNRLWGTQLCSFLSGLEARHGDGMVALDYLTVAIRNHHESGNIGLMHNPLAILAVFLDQLGRYEPAATIAGFAAVNPLAAATIPELGTASTHLRDVLGEATYESLARKGETMTIAAMATYVYDQIDQARAELNAVS